MFKFVAANRGHHCTTATAGLQAEVLKWLAVSVFSELLYVMGLRWLLCLLGRPCELGRCWRFLFDSHYFNDFSCFH